MSTLGIDIGGSGIKGAQVNTRSGELTTERVRIDTPQPSMPERCARVVQEIVEQLQYHGPVGVTFPSVVRHGITLTAANVDKRWIDCDAEKLLRETLGLPVVVLNDADAAGIAEVHFGAGKDASGVVAMFTFGTGIGSAFFVDGRLMPNTEFGHLTLRGKDAERRASAKVKEDKNLSWKEWAQRVNEFFVEIDKLFTPDLIIIGGGISRKFDKFGKHLKSGAQIVPAKFLNDAGIIGAALQARHARSEQK
ncbi:MAG: polyphosphate glucokinase [Chloroflexi bacterium]|nr:MAG: polyphosphate glucokinase [Chloroflexota bacterium]